MNLHREQGDAPGGVKGTNLCRDTDRPRAAARRAGADRGGQGAPRPSVIAPVHYLQGEITLRPYRAQCAQFLRLYDRGRAEGLYGRGGAAPPFAQLEPDGAGT